MAVSLVVDCIKLDTGALSVFLAEQMVRLGGCLLVDELIIGTFDTGLGTSTVIDTELS